jgi:hypothetical protein
MEHKQIKVSANIDAELLHKFKVKALKDGYTMTELILEWVRLYVKEGKK